MAILEEIVEILVGGITQVATGIGSGLQSLVQNIFLTGSGTTESPYALSTFGIVIVVFGGVGLALGLSRWVLNFVTSLGARNR